MSQQLDQIRNYITDNMLFEDSEIILGNDDSLFGNGIIDSQGFMEMVLWLEFTFDLTIDYDEMLPENLDSIQSISEFIQRKKLASN